MHKRASTYNLPSQHCANFTLHFYFVLFTLYFAILKCTKRTPTFPLPSQHYALQHWCTAECRRVYFKWQYGGGKGTKEQWDFVLNAPLDENVFQYRAHTELFSLLRPLKLKMCEVKEIINCVQNWKIAPNWKKCKIVREEFCKRPETLSGRPTPTFILYKFWFET